MTGLTPYLLFPGDARSALETYLRIFGGELELHTYGEFGRDDGLSDAIAHGSLHGPVELFAADAEPGAEPLQLRGILFSLLGADEPAVLERWFAELAEGGTVVDPLQKRPWGDHDGQVTDRFGITWLIGYEG